MLRKAFSIILVAFILSSLLAVTGYCEGDQNLIKNPGFEDAKGGVPSEWSLLDSNLPAGVTTSVVDGGANNSSKCYKISNGAPHDTMLIQTVPVKADSVYKVVFWLKTENIKNQAGSPNFTAYYVSNNAGCKGILSSQEIQNTNNKWEKYEFSFKTLKDVSDPLTIGLRLGGQGTTNEGTAYFDDLSMTLVEKPDSSVSPLGFYIPGQGVAGGASAPSGSTDSKSFDFKTPLFIILGIAILGLLIFVELKLSKRNKNKAEAVEEEAGEETEEGENDESGDEDGEATEECGEDCESCETDAGDEAAAADEAQTGEDKEDK